jgi:hypothetical protein
MDMQKRFGAAVVRQVQAEHDVKVILQQAGVMPGFNHYYMAFAKKVIQIIGKHVGQTACNEVDIEMEKWRQRGLLLNILEAIRDMYIRCGHGAVQPFRCDVSLLDGEDVLS